MYSPLHASAGLLLAQAIPNPIAAFFVGVGSHYLLDAVPHGDTGFGSWMTGGNARRRITLVETVDLGLATITVLFLLIRHQGQPWLPLVAGAVGGVTPDLLWGARFVLESLGWRWRPVLGFLHLHDRLHRWGHAKHAYDLPFVVGLVVQAVLLSLVFLLQL